MFHDNGNKRKLYGKSGNPFFLFVSRNLSKYKEKKTTKNLDFILRFLAMSKLKRVWLWSSGLTKTFRFFRLFPSFSVINKMRWLVMLQGQKYIIPIIFYLISLPSLSPEVGRNLAPVLRIPLDDGHAEGVRA